MPTSHHLLAFALALLTFSLLPGPAMIYTAAQTMARGRTAGLMAAFGLHCGGYVHIACVSAGLAALLQYVPALYGAIKLAGALYLIWLGIGVLRGAASGNAPGHAAQPRSARRWFAQSVAVEVLNPKSALFYLAFLPQFVDAASPVPVWAQFAAFGFVANAAFSLADVAVTLSAASVLRRLGHSAAAACVMRWAGGSLLIGLGARLATARD